MAYLGYNTIGGSSGTYSSATVVAVGPYTMTESGSANTIEIYTDNYGGNITIGIYANSGGTPGALIADTAGGTLSGTASAVSEWRGQPISASLTGGESYWLAANDEPEGLFAFHVNYDTGGKDIKYFSSTYVNGTLPDPFNASPSTANQEYSIRLNYTPSAGGTYGMSASMGSYTVTGNAATLLASRVLTADTGYYTYTGYGATLAYSGATGSGSGSIFRSGIFGGRR